jgi:hypothetical protein
MTESVIKGLTVAERAWIRRYARAGMPLAELADYASAKADANVPPEEVEQFLKELDGSTNEARQDPVKIVSGGLMEVLKQLNPAEKAWIRIGFSRGKSPAGIAAALTAKHGIRVDPEEVAIYVGTPPSGDEALPSEKISTIEDLARRIAKDVDDEDLASLSEAETSDRYIKPFFRLLGWDFQNPSQVKQNRFNGKGVSGQPQFDIHLDYRAKARSIIVEAKRFVTGIVDASGGLRPMHQKQFEKYQREKPRILVFTSGKELIAFDKQGAVLVIKHTDWTRSFDDAKKLMARP